VDEDVFLIDGLPEGFQILSSDPPALFARELSSTSDALKDLLDGKGVRPWTSLACEYQTAGRGRPGNRWISRPGDLTMSQWVERGSFRLPSHLPISLYVASACLSVLDQLGFCQISWKYPNDLFAFPGDGREEKKLGGILVEPAMNRKTASGGDAERPSVPGWVCGIGLNIRPRQNEEGDGSGETDPAKNPEGGSIGLSDLLNEKSGSSGHFPLPLSVMIARTLKDTLLEKSEEEVRGHLEGHLLWNNRWIVYSLSGQNGLGLVSGLGEWGELRILDSEGRRSFLGPNVRNVRVLSGARSHSDG
jgi:BirA family biotin operon repressor/biotin-[acetyl-CoA-carboxylase] ligase